MREKLHLVATLSAILTALLITSCGGSSLSKQVGTGGGFLPITVTVVNLSGWDVSLASTQELDSVTLYFKNGTNSTHSLSGYAATVHSDSSSEMTYLKAGTKTGDYWYFDKLGNWLPNGYVPKFWSSVGSAGKSASTVWVGSTQLSITANDTYSEVKVGYVDCTIDTYVTSAMSGNYELRLSGENVEAVRIILQSDGSKWYFDAAGNTLPAGSKWYADMD